MVMSFIPCCVDVTDYLARKSIHRGRELFMSFYRQYFTITLLKTFEFPFLAASVNIPLPTPSVPQTYQSMNECRFITYHSCQRQYLPRYPFMYLEHDLAHFKADNNLKGISS